MGWLVGAVASTIVGIWVTAWYGDDDQVADMLEAAETQRGEQHAENLAGHRATQERLDQVLALVGHGSGEAIAATALSDDARRCLDGLPELDAAYLSYSIVTRNPIPVNPKRHTAWVASCESALAEVSGEQRSPLLYVMGLARYAAEGPSPAALAHFAEAAKHGNTLAAWDLANVLHRGPPELRDLARAIAYYELASANHYAPALIHLGTIYTDQASGHFRPEEAARLFRIAADQGSAVAMFKYGGLFYFGVGVDRNLANAISWLEPAAEKGVGQAAFLCGLSYLEAPLGIRDRTAARKWLVQAMKLGDPNAEGVLQREGLL